MPNSGKQRALLPAYLIVGEDALKREAVMRRLRTRLSETGDLEFNSDDLDGEHAEGSAIVLSCTTMPFASDVRLVHVRNADKLGKADADQVVSYLKNPASTAVLALEAEKLAKNTRLYKAVAALGSSAVIDCTPPKAKELPNRVREMAMVHGITLTADGAAALVDLLGEDTVRLDGELAKLALACPQAQPLDAAVIGANVARVAEAKPWNLTDALAERNLAKCIHIMERLGSTSPHGLIGMCTTRIRELIAARAFAGRGGARALASELKRQEWQVKRLISGARNYTDQELRDALRLSRDAERRMKSGYDADAEFLQWILAVVGRP